MHRLCLFLVAALPLLAQQPAPAKRAGKISTPPPTQPPLQAADPAKLPDGVEHLDLFLLLGQSNMKGRGVMPAEPKRDPCLLMLHLRDDRWYLARHPLHLTGNAQTFAGHDNAGVGPGLAFAEQVLAEKTAIGLVPCAVGGSPIQLWQKGAKLYENALRRARLALQGAPGKVRLRGVLWLQGEANARAEDLPLHAERLRVLVTDLRADLGLPDLPFIACTIGEMNEDPARRADQQAMNEILLALPAAVPGTACVDARDLRSHIGDRVHFDTAAQEEIGRRMAGAWQKLAAGR